MMTQKWHKKSKLTSCSKKGATTATITSCLHRPVGRGHRLSRCRVLSFRITKESCQPELLHRVVRQNIAHFDLPLHPASWMKMTVSRWIFLSGRKIVRIKKHIAQFLRHHRLHLRPSVSQSLPASRPHPNQIITHLNLMIQ